MLNSIIPLCKRNLKKKFYNISIKKNTDSTAERQVVTYYDNRCRVRQSVWLLDEANVPATGGVSNFSETLNLNFRVFKHLHP
jgi:hypothetical protein